MTLEFPFALLLILLIPAYWLLRKAGILKKAYISAVLGDWQGKAFEWKDPFTQILFYLSKALIYTGFLLTVIAMSDPVHKYQEKVFTSRGTDILFILDTSPSMVAKDVNGKTRLQASKDAVEKLFSEETGSRFGLVTMGSEAAVIVPPTTDYKIFRSRLQEIQAGSMGDGSAIGTGISTAVYHLISSAAPKKVIILFTDGENNAGEIHPETAAELAAQNNINLYVFGVGSKGVVSINYTDPLNGKKYSGYLNSDFDSSSLRKLALLGNGKYFETTTFEQLLQNLEQICQNESVSQDYTYRTIITSYYKPLLLISLILFISAWILIRLIMKNRKLILSRSICWLLGLGCIGLSLTNLSWGTTMVPVQKSSNAVSFVFDVSNSMLAKDETNGLSRLDAASLFARKLLSKMKGTPVSIVLCKGDGITAVPLTEDFVMAESLISVLSPNLMSAPGTSLEKGILAAKNTFSENLNVVRHIWVFTDGGDADSKLSSVLLECARKGINVKILGFGSEEGYDILAGDKKTTVHTSLQKEQILESISKVNEKMTEKHLTVKPEFLQASGKGTGAALLHTLDKNSLTDSYISYEEKTVSHYKLFLCFALFFFMAGIIISEQNIFKNPLILFAGLCLLSGCSGNYRSRNIDRTFKGASFYREKEFEKAAGEFLESLEYADSNNDQSLKDYAFYNISTAYLMSNEKEAALEKLSFISDNAPPDVKYAAFFNAGVITYRMGDKNKAADFFRKALETDSTKIEAKINLELCTNLQESSSPENQGNLISASNEPSSKNDFTNLENTIFELIKENDKNQWKNSETSNDSDLSSDY